jgi:hypothetical protein
MHSIARLGWVWCFFFWGSQAMAQGPCGLHLSELAVCEYSPQTFTTGWIPGGGTYSWNWVPAPLTGQGTPTATYQMGAGPQTFPHQFHCYRYDSVNQCMKHIEFDRYAAGIGYPVQPILGDLPAFPNPSLPFRYMFPYGVYQYDYPVVCTWNAAGGTLLQQSSQGWAYTYSVDTASIQWSGPGPHSITLNINYDYQSFWYNSVTCNKTIILRENNTAIMGPTTICAGNTGTYSVTPVPGANYTWIITGGTILSGQGTDQVTCQWSSQGTLEVQIGMTGFNYTLNDTVAVSAFALNLGADTEICADTSLTLAGPSGMAGYLWSTGATTASITLTAGDTVWLQVTDPSGCVAADTIGVEQLVDCVFPGDANYDGVADNLDVLSIGVYMGTSGFTRTGATLQWYGQPCTLWGGGLPGQADPKHSDCNGNGTVAANDTVAVQLNFGQTHTKASGTATTGIPLQVQALQDTVYAGDVAAFAVTLGSGTVLVDSVYGIAFDLHYTPGIASGGVRSVDMDNCWFAGAGDQLPFMRNQFPANALDLAVTRVDGLDTAGLGEIALFHLETDSSHVTPVQLKAWIGQAHLVNSRLAEQSVVTWADSVVVVPRPLVGTPEAWHGRTVRIFPNPAHESVTVVHGRGKVELALMDVWGQTVRRMDGAAGGLTTMDLKGLANGVYWVYVSGASGLRSGKVVVVN